MIASIASASILGVWGTGVSVEVHVSAGLPSFTVVGLPDTSCRESRDRVRAALLSAGQDWPSKRITVNLAPSGVPKAGSGLDLAIAVGVLVAADVVPAAAVSGRGFLGELGLDGSIRPVRGVLSLVDAMGRAEVVIPKDNHAEGAALERVTIRSVESLGELVRVLRGEAGWPAVPAPTLAAPDVAEPDLSDVRGQHLGRLALEVAAAGGHHLLLVGPPGAGKSMLAKRLVGLLPDLDDEMALLATRIHSAAGQPLPGGLLRRPPLRAPHHSASTVSVIGGGSAAMRPGEISLAHGGILLLDEMGEFSRFTLDALRQPLEEGAVRIARARSAVTYPARFLLAGTMNPCPCGAGNRPTDCRCSDGARTRYLRRVSGPLLDRFDLRMWLHRPARGDLMEGSTGEPSAVVAQRVAAARARAKGRGVRTNSELGRAALDRHASLSPGARRLLERALDSGRLSARGLHRVRCVALTLADLGGDEGLVEAERVELALALRDDPFQPGMGCAA